MHINNNGDDDGDSNSQKFQKLFLEVWKQVVISLLQVKFLYYIL